MTFLEALFLGFVQAITEFLHISSSGHLVLSQKLLVMRDGTTVTSTQYAIMYSNNLIQKLWTIIIIIIFNKFQFELPL